MSNRLRVLLADDHPGIMKSISRLLSMDYDVVGCFEDGVSLIEAAQNLEPDIIVVDLNLPKVSGLNACRQITQGNPAIKVIVFTAEDNPEIRRKAFEAGASDFVYKLALDDDLLSAVTRLENDQS